MFKGRYLPILIILLPLVATAWMISNSRATLAAPQATCNWVGGDGNWSDTAHWSCGTAPGPGDTAIIDGYPIVTLDISATVASLTLDDGTLTGSSPITITQSFTMSGWGAILSGSGMTYIAQAATFTVTGMSAGNGGIRRSIDNHGTIVIGGDPGNRLDIGANVVIHNYAGAVLDIQSNRSWLWYGGSGDRPVIQNEGTVRKAIAGETNLGDIQVNNDGLIDLTGGGIRVNLYTQSGEVRTNDATAYLLLGDPANINAGSTFTGSGWIIVYRYGTTTLNADVSILNLQVDGTLTGNSNVTVTGQLKMDDYWSKMNGNGKTILASTASMSFTGCSAGNGGLYRSIDNYGTITIGGDPGNRIDVAGGVVIHNMPNGVIHMTTNRSWLWYGGTGTTRPVVWNEGLIDKAIGGGASLNDVRLDNSGTISLTNGSLQLFYSNHSGQVLLNTADAALNLTGGEHQMADGAGFSGPGWVVLNGYPTVAFSGVSSAENLWQTNGTIRLGDPNTATLTITGAFKRTDGGFQSLNGSTLAFDGNEVHLNLEVNTAFENLTVLTDTLLIEVNPNAYANLSGNLINLGVIRKTQNVAGTGNLDFGLTGATMNIQTQGSLTAIQVDRRDSNHPNAGPFIAVGRYWSITPTGGDYTLNLTLPHAFTRPENVSVCRYSGATWDCDVDAYSATNVTRNGITALSDWALEYAYKVYIPIIRR